MITCRPLIGLDGCFLKGEYRGQLLTAIGKDGNNQMLPIAYAVVEAETINQEKNWVFIFDQQNHRLCVRHLYSNFRKRHPHAHLNELMWQVAKATTMQEWKRIM
ncbi:hypothetical protein GmHk_13G036969 [Glycine max]|nr:hypothetical protein GmHk_13G036969 [Glycine max]